jgi:hypothetical protein
MLHPEKTRLVPFQRPLKYPSPKGRPEPPPPGGRGDQILLTAAMRSSSPSPSR